MYRLIKIMFYLFLIILLGLYIFPLSFIFDKAISFIAFSVFPSISLIVLDEFDILWEFKGGLFIKLGFIALYKPPITNGLSRSPSKNDMRTSLPL